MKPYWIMVAVLIPSMSMATGSVKVTRGDESAAKFYPLDRERASVTMQNGVKIIRESSPMPLPSDRESMNQGGMRIDRARTQPITKLNSPMLIPTTQETEPQTLASLTDAPKHTSPALEMTTELMPESEAIEGLQEGYDPVLTLFDSSEGGELLSFREAMLGKPSRRQLMWPLPLGIKQTLTSGYGVRKDPFHGRQTFHGGIDIAAAVGTPVLATAEGEVIEVKSDAGFGKYIGIKHADGTISRYGHLSAQKVREGQRVRAGETIGELGSSGRSTGPHLDYRVSREGNRFDPLSVLSIPSGVDRNGIEAPASAVAMRTPGKVASNALPKRAMVIKVH